VTATCQRSAEIVVVDYGLGNLRSAVRGLERAGSGVEITDEPAAIRAADGIVLPGVGAFAEGMENADPLRPVLFKAVDEKTPLLGICLGMQMLLTESEEAERAGQGEARGLDLIPGRNQRLRSRTVPHMGWNRLDVVADHPLVAGIDGEYAYFVHSYYAVPEDDAATVVTTEYGETFASVVADGHVMGTQFHPEKSGEVGLRILRNFVDFCA
jgi:glutamine amidotransferase